MRRKRLENALLRSGAGVYTPYFQIDFSPKS